MTDPIVQIEFPENARSFEKNKFAKSGNGDELVKNRDVSDIDAVAALIELIGTDKFPIQMMVALTAIFNAECYSIHSYENGEIFHRRLVGSNASEVLLKDILDLDGDVWRSDENFLRLAAKTFQRGWRSVLICHKSLRNDRFLHMLYDRDHISSRVHIMGNFVESGSFTVLNILRSKVQTPWTERHLAPLRSLARILMAAIAKHEEMTRLSANLSMSTLTKLEAVERVAAHAPGIPRREVEVCVGILKGLTSRGIALEMGIGEQTVMTYRKRLYARLEISTQRELMLWYLKLFL